MSNHTAVFTIVSKNYLPFARVLMRSVKDVCPAWDRFVLLADRIDGMFDPSSEPFTVVEAHTLPVPDIQTFLFRYTIIELNTAVKPWFFRELLARGYERVIYLDPDIFVYSPFDDVERLIGDGALAVLVPHLTGRLSDAARPSEHDILQSGAYNLGFCALARHPSLDALLDFWCEKSLREFAVDLSRGLFTDQRWMDLVPGMFPDVHILRHDGYDVAYWNLAHRTLERDGAGYRVNGAPLVFFHFSGIDPMAPEGLSRHQDRYTLESAGVDVAALARGYCAAVRAAGIDTARTWPYAYGALDDGTPIPDVLRAFYRTQVDVEAWAGPAPFARGHEDWNAPVDEGWPLLTRVMLAAYQSRPDIRMAWPDIAGTDREAVASWFADSPDAALLVASPYREPVRASLRDRPASVSRRDVSRARNASPTSTHLLAGAVRKAVVAFRDGRLPMSPRRWLQLFRLHTIEAAQERLRRSGAPLPPVTMPARRAPRGAEPRSASDDSIPGVTIVGYLADGTGVAAGARASAGACTAAEIGHELVDARPLQPQRGRFPINLLHVNADQIPAVAGLLGSDFFAHRYTIGYWAWELEEFPEAFFGAFNCVDEVWALSSFVQHAVAERSPVPVVRMPLAVTVAPTAGLARRHFGLPDDTFLFLMMYDVLSVQERKNPLGALQAFRIAFPNPSKVGIVIRPNHAASRRDEIEIVRRAIADTPGAILMDRPMSRAEAQALQACCDSYVSLHRSEGFGLNIAEAMLLGKPAVVTGWSGNMDFTTPANSCLVDYELVRLTDDYGPYRRGHRWAEPDITQAALQMTRLAQDTALYEMLSKRGRATIDAGFSARALGARYRARLGAIERFRVPGRTRIPAG